MTDQTESPVQTVFPAGLETYHAACSIKAHGALEHGAAYAKALLDGGVVDRADQAMLLAAAELLRLERIVGRCTPHRDAHYALKRRGSSSAVLEGRSRRLKSDLLEGME